MEQDSTDRDERIQRIARNFAHEIRTPLASLLSWIRLLKSGRLSEDDQTKGLQRMEQGAILQAQLVSALVDAIELLTGSKTIQPEMLNVAAAIDQAIEKIENEASTRGIRIFNQLSDRDLLAYADPDSLESILFQVISNAVQFNQDGGEVQIGAEINGSEASITVTDTGTGIEPGSFPFLYEAYAHRELFKNQHGVGIGLMMARKLAEMNGGRIEVTNRSDTNGTRVRITLLRRKES